MTLSVAYRTNGRPTKFDKKRDYLALCEDYLTKTIASDKNIISLTGFCLYLNINEDTAIEWYNKYPKSSFSEAYKKIKDMQKQYLMSGVSNPHINPAMAIFLLKVNHGMIETEKKQIDITGSKITIDTK